MASFYTVDEPGWAAQQVELVRQAAKRERFTGAQAKAYHAGQVDARCEAAGLSLIKSTYGDPRVPGGGRRHYIVFAQRPAQDLC